MPQIRRPSAGRTRVLLASATVGTLLMTVPDASAALGKVGDVDAATGFPAWVEDASGTRVDLCLDGLYCLATAADMVAPDGEAFWWQAESTVATSNGSALLVMAIEAAYGGSEPGREDAFSRIRMRIDVPGPGDYTVTHPYGTKTFKVSAGGRRAINDTVDIGCFSVPDVETCASGTPKRFDLLAKGQITSLLKWDPTVAPAAPIGFLGDGNTPHKVVGTGPLAKDPVFRIDGPNIGGPGVNFVQTDLMSVQGRTVAAPRAATVGRHDAAGRPDRRRRDGDEHHGDLRLVERRDDARPRRLPGLPRRSHRARAHGPQAPHPHSHHDRARHRTPRQRRRAQVPGHGLRRRR